VITEEHVRELLTAEDGDASLMLVDGGAVVMSPAAGERSGALEVLSRADLETLLGTAEPSEERLRQVASTLEAVAANRGA
jgi:hypothetical protein